MTEQIHERAPIATLEGAQRVALSQAKQLAKQATKIQELIRERDTALAKQDEALVLAAEYARRSGLPITDAQVAASLEHEQRLLTLYDRRNSNLESFYFSVWQKWVLVFQPRVLSGQGLTPDGLKWFGDFLTKLMDACKLDKPGPREKAGHTSLFAVPEVKAPSPSQEPDLFSDGAA